MTQTTPGAATQVAPATLALRKTPMPITPDSVFEGLTKNEAKAVVIDTLATARAVLAKHGEGHPTSVEFINRYWDYYDAYAERYGREIPTQTA